ncbi:MAG: GDP-mannose 4,6-dehydratase [Candidatus Thermoplasmatota archaeon]|nr:GDP-mannose 4,6-dehydratase [Candidatus Thermoplasmatota archaeon]
MRVLITGINGFIGSWLAEELLSRNISVAGTVLHKRKTNNINHIKDRIEIIQCDIRNKNIVEKIIKKVFPDLIFHLAAQSFPTVSWLDPTGTVETNVIGTINIFESVRRTKLNPKILVACSSAEYGLVTPEEVPVKEEHTLLPLHPYGVSKVAQDLLAYQYFKNFDIHTVRARIFNTTGPRKVNDVCSDFASRIAELEVNKKENKMLVGNLNTRRDFTDVRDVVHAFWLLMEHAKPGEVYNICSSKAYLIKDILDKLLGYSIKEIKIEIDPKKLRPADEPIIMGDNTKLKAQCGWEPKIPIDKTLKDTLNYWRNIYSQEAQLKVRKK